MLGRGKRFGHADAVLETLIAEVSTGFDHLVFSGDATALGFRREIEKAAQILQVEKLPGLAVPGNHDYCTTRAANSGDFERCFEPWMKGERIDDQPYPFAQKVGDYWLVGVNSARGNRWFWDASGSVTPQQCDRLRRLLTMLSPGPRILVTHYPICLSNGKHEGRAHGLRNLAAILEVAAAGGVCLWLHGHRHHFYYHQRPPLASFPCICIGSSTEMGRWSFGDYTLDGKELKGQRRCYNPISQKFVAVESFQLKLSI